MIAYLTKNTDADQFIQAALRDYTGTDQDFVIKMRPTGKPYIEGGPCFSFSDSHGYFLCVVSDHEVGADIEFRRSAEKYMDVARRFFAPDERDAATADNFFEIYTAKGAYVKFTEMGIFSGMEHFSTMSGRVGNVYITRFSDGDCICAAASEKEREVEIKWILS